MSSSYLGSQGLSILPIPVDGLVGEVLTIDTLIPFIVNWQPGGGGGGGAPTNAEYVVMSINATLTNERVLAVETGVVGLTDGGANGNVTISLVTNGVPLSKLPTMAQGSFIGRITSGTGNPEALTSIQATSLLNLFSTTLKGLAPASGGGTSNFLRADGTWAVPPGTGSGFAPDSATYLTLTANGSLTNERVLDFNTARFTVVDNGPGGAYQVDLRDGGVTYAKIQDVSATNRLLGRISSGAGTVEELTTTQITTLINAFTSLLSGAVPASGGGTTTFLRADGTFAIPPGGGGGFDYGKASTFQNGMRFF